MRFTRHRPIGLGARGEAPTARSVSIVAKASRTFATTPWRQFSPRDTTPCPNRADDGLCDCELDSSNRTPYDAAADTERLGYDAPGRSPRRRPDRRDFPGPKAGLQARRPAHATHRSPALSPGARRGSTPKTEYGRPADVVPIPTGRCNSLYTSAEPGCKGPAPHTGGSTLAASGATTSKSEGRKVSARSGWLDAPSSGRRRRARPDGKPVGAAARAGTEIDCRPLVVQIRRVAILPRSSSAMARLGAGSRRFTSFEALQFTLRRSELGS
jgi:hypothetical protein